MPWGQFPAGQPGPGQPLIPRPAEDSGLEFTYMACTSLCPLPLQSPGGLQAAPWAPLGPPQGHLAPFRLCLSPWVSPHPIPASLAKELSPSTNASRDPSACAGPWALAPHPHLLCCLALSLLCGLTCVGTVSCGLTVAGVPTPWRPQISTGWAGPEGSLSTGCMGLAGGCAPAPRPCCPPRRLEPAEA